MKRSVAVGWAALLGAPALAAAADVPLAALPRPGPQLRVEAQADGAVRRNAGCEHCHREIAEEWRSSRHHRSYENAEFQRALKREPRSGRQFCVRCHAPEASPRAFQKTAALGVACVTCHTPLGPVLAAPGKSARRAPHALLRSERFVNGDACGGCHEFSFPAPNQHLQMQRTLSEHRAAAGPRIGCSGCHMAPSGAGPERHAGHTFPGGHDTALVRSSLTIATERPTADRVRVQLVPNNTTHAVPTGDLFRRISVSVTTSQGFAYRRFLSRHFADVSGRRRENGDDRAYRGPTTVDVFLPTTALGVAARYRVAFQRVAHITPGREEQAVLDGEVVLAEGELAPPPRRSGSEAVP